MKVLLWHGYLLSGSGSNIYTAEVTRRWRAMGHQVLLMCQERAIDSLDFIDEAGDFDERNEVVRMQPTRVEASGGRAFLARPAIGDVLPVYVYDRYEGFTAKRFVDLTDDELSAYTDANIQALVTAIKRFQPDAIVTGHEVMGPYIARRACAETGTAYVAKLHGSALEYAVKEQDRYKHYAHEGLTGARAVVGGSRYMIEEAHSVVPGWIDRATVVNPGCDVELFRPLPREDDVPTTVGYVGKLIFAKGVHHLLAALALVETRPLRLVVVGYGEDEGPLRDLACAFHDGDVDAVRRLVAHDRDLSAILDELSDRDDYWQAARSVDVEFLGRLDHGPLSGVLPKFDVLAVPSVVPEAFGMVAAEAAACAVLPVVPGHSGIAEAGRALEDAFVMPGLLTYDASDPVVGLAAGLDRVLSLDASTKKLLGDRAVAVARDRWSWDHVANRLLELAVG